MRKLFATPLPRPDPFLVGILLLALALRVWGLGWGLPSATHYFSYHPDESRVLEASSLTMNVFAGRLLPHFYNYGSLQLYLVCFANTLAALFGGLEIVPRAMASWYPQWAKMYLVGRWLTVSMGVGTVWAVYATGRRLWGRRAGLLAALTLAIMPLHAQHSHFLTVDVPATFWAMLSLLWAVRLATGEPKAWKAALWAGVFAGFAAATKYNLALIVLPLLMACVIRGGSPPPPILGSRIRAGSQDPSCSSSYSGTPELRRGGLLLLFLTGLAAFAFAFLVACPGVVLESGAFLRDLRFEAVHVQNTDDPTFRGTGSGFVYHITRNLSAGLGLPLLLLTLVSVGCAVTKRERGDGLLAAFALPYYVLIGLAAIKYARYDIPLLPILALWNGRLLAEGMQSALPHLRENTKWAAVSVLLLTSLYTTLLIGLMGGVDVRDKALYQLQVLRQPEVSPSVGPNAARYEYSTIAFASQPWFSTPPLSPYFSMPKPGGWRKFTSPEVLQRIVYEGKDWDSDLLNARRPDAVVVTEFDYADSLRQKDPVVLHYLSDLHRDYGARYVNIYPFNPIVLFDLLSPHGYALPEQGLPHDMLYTNPYIIIYQRKPAPTP